MSGGRLEGSAATSGDAIQGPFERVATPEQAVDRLTQLYEEATQALRGAVERFLKDGEPPSAATRALFRYPELCVDLQPSGAVHFNPPRLGEIPARPASIRRP